MTVSRTLLLCWALLVALSIGTVLTGASGLWPVVLLLAVAKGWVIADGFMELRHAPRLWPVSYTHLTLPTILLV